MVVLDTHVWVWWINGQGKLSRKATSAINAATNQGGVYISSISAWEIAMLVYYRRLKLTLEVRDWLAACENLPFLHFIPINNSIAVASVRFPGKLHKDPADRIIVATAREFNFTLITKDKRLQEYPHVETIW